MAEWYCSIGGRRYGPVDEAELRTWIQQGRIRADDSIWTQGMPDWVTLQDSGVLGAGGLEAAGEIDPYAYALPMKNHRGEAVLVLGILGIVICFICGIIAWVMGNSDLREMASGTMDPSGKGLTKAGKICGMIGVILNAIIIGLAILGALLEEPGAFD